ncbi:MAG: glucose 1-dehydrogenase [Deltaproteobacteria bacterium]|nr:glucose 1-dehydrogenase [Deltaproteobacteria bacterium]MBI2532507.1 glucose 1-dehydrogenase [Deltaproteobacteria bacterium]MBI3067209.1 glucose 1-dehydrogenase [Deltaproteobacteria bacterium]
MIEGLRDKVVIVTGGGHGIGKAYCCGFAKAGSRVVAADIDAAAAERTAAEIGKDAGAQALAVHVDVSNEEATKRMAARALERFGRIDVLINNAAIFSVVPMNRGKIETIDPQEWDRLMAVNLRGLFFCCRAVLPAMRKQKSGKIINVASGTVFAGSPGRIHYVTSKAATIGFTRTLAREVGDDNINVNCLAPGNTLSEENPTEQMIKFRESSVGLRSLKRIQVPQDVVGAMLFLASPLSDFMTGQTVNVDGGISFL